MSLKKLSHTNIVKLYEVFQDEINIYLVMEYVEGESLMSKHQFINLYHHRVYKK